MNAIKIVSLIGKAAAVASLMDWTSIPPKYAVLIYMVSSVLKDVTNRIGDYLDDNQMNNSFKQ